MAQSRVRLPVSYYKRVGFAPNSDDNEVVIEKEDDSRIALNRVIVNNTSGAAVDVTLKAGDAEGDMDVILEESVGDGDTEVLIDSPHYGLAIDGDLIVQFGTADEDVVISAWGVSG